MNGFFSVLDGAGDWPQWGLTLAAGAAVSAGLLAGVVLVVNAFARRWLSARQMGWLWALVLVRLLVPIAPPSSFSLQNLLPSAEPRPIESDLATALFAPNPSAAPSPYAAALAVSKSTDSGRSQPPPSIEERLFSAFPAIWLIGASGILLWTAIVHWRFCRMLKQATACNEERARRLWEQCCRQVGIRHEIPLVVFDGVPQPAVFGLFRPLLLLPPVATELKDGQLRMVMLHELAHVRGRHVAANWLLVLVRAVHWWNPVSWLAATRYRNLREQSCDAFALSQIAGRPVREYGELLLELAQSRPAGRAWNVMLPASILGFLSTFLRKRALANRLKALQSSGVTGRRWQRAFAMIVIGLLGLCGLTDASPSQAHLEGAHVWFLQSGTREGAWTPSTQTDPGPSVTQSYDIGKALERIARSQKGKENARKNIHWTVAYLLRAYSGRYASLTDEWAERQFSLRDQTLTVSAPRSVQAEIARNLSAWEKSGLWQMSIEARFITDQQDIAARVGVSWESLAAWSTGTDDGLPPDVPIGPPSVRTKAWVDDYLPVAVAVLSEQQASRLVHAAEAATTANIFQTAKVTCFNGQLVSMTERTRRPFVVGVDEESAGTRRPRVEVIDEGMKLTLRPVQSAGANAVELAGRLELSQIGAVGTASAVLRGKAATIQVPRVTRRRIDLSSAIPDRQSLLLGFIATREEKKFFYLMVTVRRVVEGWN